MKHTLFLLLFCYCSNAQTKQSIPVNINGGNNQFGNNNVQNINSERTLTNEYKRMILAYIIQLEYDSNFHYTKYFRVSTVEPCNCAKMAWQLHDFFRSRGLINKMTGGGIGAILGVEQKHLFGIGLIPKDSLISISIGQFTND